MPETQVVVSPAELEQVYDALKTADPEQEGVGADRVKLFTGFRGWGKIYGALYALRDSGRVTVKRKGAPVPIEQFTWQEGNQ
jgi:hypothetical protein